MTTSKDEIASLCLCLEHIGQFIRHERRYGDPTDANSSGKIMRSIEKMVKAGLKTPRAREIHVHITGEGLPPFPNHE